MRSPRLAVSASTALVLSLLSALGVQINSKYSGDAINEMMLSVILFVAGFSILSMTLLSFAMAMRQNITPVRLRALLLNEVPLRPSAAAPPRVGGVGGRVWWHGCQTQHVTFVSEHCRSARALPRLGEFSIYGSKAAAALSFPTFFSQDAEPESSGPARTQRLFSVARFGQFTINPEDVAQALNAPLLTDDERRVLQRETSLLANGATDIRGTRFVVEPSSLVFGLPREAALGIEHFMCVNASQVRAGMSAGVTAIRREVEAFAAVATTSEAADALECLNYVQHARAGSSGRTFPNSPFPRE